MHSINPDYLDDNGNIKMCQCCKKVLIKESETWILDTELYAEPPENVMYDICHRCDEQR